MDEINEKLTELKEKEEGIINTTEPITNEISVILVGSQLQQAVIKAVMNKDESEIEKSSEEYYQLLGKSKYARIKNWGEFKEGNILLQDEGPRTAFRNIKLRVIKKDL